MAKKREFGGRYTFFAVLFTVMCLVFIARLINIQVTGNDLYKSASASVKTDYITRTVKIQAHRGEIYDRNGVPLVTNAYSYNIDLDRAVLSTNELLNAEILKIVAVAEQFGGGTLTDPDFYSMGTYPEYRYDSGFLSGTAKTAKFRRLLKNYNFEELPEYTALAEKLLYHYGITDKEGILLYSVKEADILMAYRFDMELGGFAANTPYTILNDVTIELITRLKEGTDAGINIYTEVERVYNEPGYASHILGRVGKIQSSRLEYYTELGYPMDAIVGIDGAEAAFEQYLRGIDGEMVIVEDGYGNILEQYVSVEPQAGHNVWLTIDIQMQKVAEIALASNIQYIVEKAVAGGEEKTGEDADAGALSVIMPKTGDVLALASYPTYNLATFNEDFAALNTDPMSPMFNRALSHYEPGSTFKVAVAGAALTEAIITPETKINDVGQYTAYKDYQPRCWIYLRNGTSHGHINVTEAIQVSCNYFFFEVGRLLTIERMNDYCSRLGLGVSTGIELPESLGVLAGPAYRENNGKEAWSPGDTLQAAIGQSDNAFTPLQISVYMGTIIENGQRNSAHLLSKVTEFYTDKVVYAYDETVLSRVELSADNRNVLLNAMKSVTENGSAARVFSSYPITIGGKTGTAQTGTNKSDNAIFTAFAPFDAPEIVATCIIERGANGTDAGFAVRDVFDYYFELNEDIPGDYNEEVAPIKEAIAAAQEIAAAAREARKAEEAANAG